MLLSGIKPVQETSGAEKSGGRAWEEGFRDYGPPGEPELTSYPFLTAKK
jgi:hypothetical protein